MEESVDCINAVRTAGHSGSRHGGLLGGVGSAFARALEAEGARRRPTDRAPVWSRDGYNRVVKGRLDASQTVWHDPALALFLEFLLALCRFPCCRRCSLLCFLSQMRSPFRVAYLRPMTFFFPAPPPLRRPFPLQPLLCLRA